MATLRVAYVVALLVSQVQNMPPNTTAMLRALDMALGPKLTATLVSDCMNARRLHTDACILHPRASHASAPMVAMEVDHREPPPDRSSHDSAAAAYDHRTMGIRPIDVRSSHLTRDEADDFLGAHQRAGTRLSRVRPRRQRWNNMVRDRGDHLWELPRKLVGLERVGYRNGIHCTLSFNRRWFQWVAFGGWRKLVSDRRALIRACLAHRLPMRAVDIITFMAFPVRGTSLPLQR